MPKAFARNTFLGFASGAAAALAGFVGTAIAARLLGPEGMGVIAYAVWCVTVAATIAGLGIGLVLQRFIPNLRAEGKHNEAEGLIGAMARLSVLAAIVGTLLLFGWLYWPGGSAIDGPSRAPRIVVIVLVLAYFICYKLADVYLSYLRGEQRFDEFARLSGFSAVIKMVLLGLGAWLFGIPGALAGYVAGSVLPASRIWRLLRNKPSVGQQVGRQVMSFALISWSVGVMSGLVYGRTEIVFLEHYAGLVAVGLFAAAATLTDTMVLLTPLLLSAQLPYFSEQQGLGEYDHLRRVYRTATGLVALLVVPLCIGIAAIAPVLVPVLFGAEFADSVPAASVLLIAAAVWLPGVTTHYLIYSTGKIRLLLVSNALGLVGTIALGFFLIPRFGLMGAAWSRAVVQVSVVAIETWYVTRRLGFAPPYRALGAIALAAGIQGAVAYLIITGLGGIMSLVVAIPAGLLVFAVALRVLAVLPMVDPALIDTVISHAPRRLRHLLSWVLKLVSPSSKGPSAPE
jgi:O-antigen/teichoic acid export membrane protein